MKKNPYISYPWKLIFAFHLYVGVKEQVKKDIVLRKLPLSFSISLIHYFLAPKIVQALLEAEDN